MAETSQNQEILDLGGLTDEQIATLSPDQIDKYLASAMQDDQAANKAADDAPNPDEQGGDQSAAADGEGDTGSDETGGAVSDFQSLDPFDDVAGKTSANQSPDLGTGKAAAQSSGEHQASQADGEADSSGEVDWKAKYEASQATLNSVLGSFKASGRTVKVESPDDARRLMQMGYDYTNKMREMKPHLRILKTLEHNGLLEDEKINFVIDLMKGSPEAITKFLKDKKIDPIELDLESGTVYKPTDHRPSDEQLALDEVLDSIRDTEAFPRTAQVITKEWDKASQQVLMGNPRIIAIINDHMNKGYYDKIAAKMQYERSLGRLAGLSDLDAYKAVGDAMQAQGVFTPAAKSTTSEANGDQGPSQDSQGSDDSVKNLKRAASPTKGGAGAGNAPPKNFLNDYSDEEIEKMGRPL